MLRSGGRRLVYLGGEFSLKRVTYWAFLSGPALTTSLFEINAPLQYRFLVERYFFTTGGRAGVRGWKNSDHF